METVKNTKIVLEDGSVFEGFGKANPDAKPLEIVFNTSMTGYQEIVSDPCYIQSLVVMTYPLIGGYGINDEDFENKVPFIGALAVKELNDTPSNFRSTGTVREYLEEHSIPYITGIDTRKLARHIREYGTCKAMITPIERDTKEVLDFLKTAKEETNLVEKVSSKKRWYMRTANARYHVVAVDCGIKLSMIKSLLVRGCNVTIVPYNTPFSEMEALHPDGLFLSGGPGNPKDVPYVRTLLSSAIGQLPIFAVGLGHELLGLAFGGDVLKLKVGHRGCNHPVKNLETGKIHFVNQNHAYALNEKSLENTPLKVTEKDLTDDTVAGMECMEKRLFSVQYEESAPVLDGSVSLYDRFVAMMKKEEC